MFKINYSDKITMAESFLRTKAIKEKRGEDTTSIEKWLKLLLKVEPTETSNWRQEVFDKRQKKFKEKGGAFLVSQL